MSLRISAVAWLRPICEIPILPRYALAFWRLRRAGREKRRFPCRICRSAGVGKTLDHPSQGGSGSDRDRDLTGMRGEVAGRRRKLKPSQADACLNGVNQHSGHAIPAAPGVVRRLAEREQTILGAAHSIVGEEGMGAVQIVAVAQPRRYRRRHDLPLSRPEAISLLKSLLPPRVAELVDNARRWRCRAGAAFGCSPLASQLSAAEALHDRRLAWAIMAEPIGLDIDALRLNFRRAIAAELEMRISMAVADGTLPDQDVRVAALAVIGAVLEVCSRAAGAARWQITARPFRDDARSRCALSASSMRVRGPRRAMRAAVSLS